jgi:hypothetical protein
MDRFQKLASAERKRIKALPYPKGMGPDSRVTRWPSEGKSLTSYKSVRMQRKEAPHSIFSGGRQSDWMLTR